MDSFVYLPTSFPDLRGGPPVLTDLALFLMVFSLARMGWGAMFAFDGGNTRVFILGSLSGFLRIFGFPIFCPGIRR